jgi:hypothetical protein
MGREVRKQETIVVIMTGIPSVTIGFDLCGDYEMIPLFHERPFYLNVK